MKKMFSPLPILAAALCLIPFSQSVAAAAEAPSGDVNAAMVEINKKAYKMIQSRQHDAAKDELIKAVVMGKDAGLQGYDIMARTHVHLAAALISGPRGKPKAVNQFVIALRINPNITITPGLQTPALKTAYLTARKHLGLPPKPDLNAPPPMPPPPRPAVTRATPAKTEEAPPVEEKPAAPVPAAEVEEEEKAPIVDDDPLKKIIVSQAEDEDRRLFHRRLPNSLIFGISGGAGAGYHLEEYVDSGARNASQVRAIGESNAAKIKAPRGFTPARLFHIEAEVGYQFSKKFWMTAMARYQHAPKEGSGGQNAGEKPILTSALAAYLRASYAYATFGNFQAYGIAGGGVGKHFLLYFPQDCKEASADNNCLLDHSDTLSTPAGVGVMAGLGFTYHLARGFALFLEGKEVIPVSSKIMALSEVNLGMAIAINLVGESVEPAREGDRGYEPPSEEEEVEEEEEPSEEESP